MLKTNTDLGLLVLRLWFGIEMVIAHGWPKLKNLVAGNTDEFINFLGLGTGTSYVLAVFGEFVCGLLIAFGLFTRLATIPFMITMLVAAFMVHWDDGWGQMSFPLMYFFAALTLLLTGPGKYSLDQWRADRLKA